MLSTTITTTDSVTGADLQIPAALMNRVRRADELLRVSLGEVKEKFDLTATWRFARGESGKLQVLLEFTGDEGLEIRNHAFTAEDLADDRGIRRALFPAVWELGDRLSALVGRRFDRTVKGLHETIVALAASPED